jgi:hypothetical protein
MTSLVLTNLLKKYSHYKNIRNNIFAVIHDPKKYEAHAKLRQSITITNNFTPEFYAYHDEFHEFMYIKTSVGKSWYKPGKDNELHCTKTFRNEVTGLTETYPARIDDDHETFWCRDGILFRTDVDQYGNLLPTKTSDTVKTWNLEKLCQLLFAQVV